MPVESFWPTTLVGWLEVFAGYLVAVVAALASTWQWLTRPINKRIDDALLERVRAIDQECRERVRADNGLGERIADVATTMQTTVGKVEILERAQERSSIDRETLHESVGALRSEVSRLLEMANADRVSRIADMGVIRERMVAIETKMDGQHSDLRDRLARFLDHQQPRG